MREHGHAASCAHQCDRGRQLGVRLGHVVRATAGQVGGECLAHRGHQPGRHERPPDVRTADGGSRRDLQHLPVIAALLKRDAIDAASLRRNLLISGINLLATRSLFKDHPMRKDYVEPDDYEYEPTPHDHVLERAKQQRNA